MKSHNIITASTFNPELLEFTDVKTNNYGGKVVYTNYDNGKFRVQTPEMTIPYGLGVNEIIDQKTNEVIGHKYHTNLSFKGMDIDNANGKKLVKFHKFISNLDDIVVKKAMSSSLSWLKMKKASEETTRALYSQLILCSKDKETQEPNGKYPDTIKGKIIYYDDNFITEVYDKDKNLVNVKENIVKGATARALIESTGVWFAGGKFGMGWKIIQIRVKVPEKITGYAFVPSDSEDDEDEEVQAVSLDNKNVDSDSDEEVVLEKTKTNLGKGVDSDSDSDSDQDEPPPNLKM